MRRFIIVLSVTVLGPPIVSAQEVELRDGGSVTIRTGGSLPVPGCGLSYATDEDFAWLQHRGTGFTDLYVWVEGADDTMLAVLDPDDTWHCDDNSHGDLQPLVRIPRSKSGMYGIYVGLHTPDVRGTATVYASLSMPAPLTTQSSTTSSAPGTITVARGVMEVGQGALAFGTALKAEAMSAGWPERRDAWVSQVHAARTPAELSEAALALETSMGWQSVDETWSGKRDAWVAGLGAAEDAGDVAEALLALEAATRWEAVSEQWADVRETWVAQLRAAAGR
jgi:hypothetical protein